MLRPTWISLASLALIASGCVESKTKKDPPHVQISGPATVRMGETAALMATTVGGSDSVYTWTSLNTDVATVDATGVVSALAMGSVVIHVTGANSHLTGTWGMVVVDSAGNAAVTETPHADDWFGSGHADASGEAFRHWDGDGEIPTGCAKCHSTSGLEDFLGVDGSAVGTVDHAAPLGETVECKACHNPAAMALTSVTFPSGKEVTGLDHGAICMQCHQGRESDVSVDTYLEGKGFVPGTTDEDAVLTGVSFRNIHYFAAGATLMGAQASGGYEYTDKTYDVRFAHVTGFDSCVTCHNPHTLQLNFTQCETCHAGAEDAEATHEIRMMGSTRDYDGDGNVQEGIAHELDGVAAKLYTAIQNYAVQHDGDTAPTSHIVYDGAAHPYWFVDNNDDGEADINIGDPDDDEDDAPIGYNTWTARLMRAAYNYQYYKKDPGAFAHNGKYVIELLFDSIEDLHGELDADTQTAIALASMSREDAGHFMSGGLPFRDWDDRAEVPAGCARCHSATGLPTYLAYGTNIGAAQASGLMCSTCHQSNNATGDNLRAADTVTFPSGKEVSGLGSEGLCMSCHQGREGTATVDAYLVSKGYEVGTTDDNVVLEGASFRNVHYFAAGATQFGAWASGGYEFAGKSYQVKFAHATGYGTCSNCHDAHGLELKLTECQTCHPDATTVAATHDIRMEASPFDYDGDANVTEGIAGELSTLADDLYAQIKAYAVAHDADLDPAIPTDHILYAGASYPYWFKDANDDGVIDVDGESKNISYVTWTPNLLRAAYNYQFYKKDPGAFAHNGKYVIELLIDSIEALGGDVSGYHRDDAGHFDSSTLAFRDWDDGGEVRNSCARCHSATGLATYLATGSNVAEPLSSGLMCSTCHTSDNATGVNVRAVTTVKFPYPSTILSSGLPARKEISLTGGTVDANGDASSYVCMTCHQGRESTNTVNDYINDPDRYNGGDDVVLKTKGTGDSATKPSFRNVHYLPAGATRYGTQAGVGYEYDGMTYSGFYAHTSNNTMDQCSDCHKTHRLEVKVDLCAGCHGAGAADPTTIAHGSGVGDVDGDGNADGPYMEALQLADALHTEILAYAVAVPGTRIVYSASSHPYWFVDADNNGVPDVDSEGKKVGYSTWTPRLLRAAYNYQYYRKEPGAFAHNAPYLMQLLCDSLADLGNDVCGTNRP